MAYIQQRLPRCLYSRFAKLILALTVCMIEFGCRTGAGPIDSTLMSDSSTANLCRWREQTSYDDLLQQALYAYDLPAANYTDQAISSPSITQSQLLEDLDCLKLTFQTAYAATDYFSAKGINLVSRVEALRQGVANEDRSYSRKEILEKLAELHDGAFDGHAFYFFYNMVAAWQGQTQQIGTKVAPPYPVFVYTAARFTKSNTGKVQYVQSNGSKVDVDSCDRMAAGTLANNNAMNGAGQSLGDVTFVGYRKTSELQNGSSVTCKLTSGANINIPIAAPSSLNDAFPTTSLRAKGAELTVLDGDVQYLRIGDFPNPMTPEQKDIVDTLATTDKPLIVDVRGIGGGADPFTTALENALFTADEVQQSGKRDDLISLLTLFGVAQVYVDLKLKWQVKPGVSPEQRASNISSLDQSLSQWRQSSLAQSQHYGLSSVDDRRTESEDSFTGGQRQHPKQKPVAIIIDRECGSQCEFLVSSLRHHPMVKASFVIGTPTAGRLNFASNGSVYLPNTKIQFIPSRVRTLHLPDAIEGEGIHPGKYIVAGDPKKAALELINAL